jgi:gas vesicle protein
MPRAEFLGSIAGSTAFLLGYSEKANAAQVVDPAEKFQAGLVSLKKEAKKATKEIKKEVKKIDRTVTKETKKLEKKVKKEVKKADREIKKDTKMVQRETKKIGTAVEQKAQKIGTVVEQKANAIVGGGAKTKMASPPKKAGIDVSRMKLCNDPKSKCL